uniref:Uncharacterized protein n=1 Tax=Panagrolaimus sp. PS1159 TaxID=55785 RepID=A0AC35GRT0_9BILA
LRLPWRSVPNRNEILDFKIKYKDEHAFKRLPREIRRLYRDLIKLHMSWIDPQMVINAFNKAIERKDPNKMYELPKWLVMPSAN